MAVSKVVVNGTTRIDLTNDTVAADKLMSSYTAHDAAGLAITGTASSGTDGQPIRNDVTFIDYDGTVLYGYSATAFASLTEMPANPTHTGLTAQGWNWTLSDAKAYVATYGKILIGQLYITSDGKTRVYIKIDDPQLCKFRIGIAKNINVSNFSATIDWGDGTTPSNTSSSSTTPVYILHEYSAIGEYVITINVTAGKIDFRTYGSSYYFIQLPNGNSGNPCIGYCSIVKKIEIGNNVASFGEYAFQYCTGLETLTIPQGLTISGYDTFRYCYALKALVTYTGLSGSYAFQYCTNLKSVSIGNNSGITSIGEYAFQNCYSLRYISISNAVTSINTYAFHNCMSLEEIIIPNSVTTISSYAFANCYSAKRTYISTALTSITANAFQYNIALLEIEIPSSITTISSTAFQNCFSLRKVIFNEGLVNINSYAFQSCYNLAEVNFPTTLRKIEIGAFNGTKIPRITIPSTITSFGTAIFANNTGLVKAVVNNTNITSYAGMFSSCNSLIYANVPSSVTTLAANAFQYCYSLKEIHFESTTPPTATNSNWYYQMPLSCIIYVPSGSLSAYTSATNYPNSNSYTYVEE